MRCVCVPGPCRATYVRLSPRWPLLLRPCACVPVLACHLVGRRWRVTRFVCLGPRLVSQGLWANAPCWAHTEALAGRLTSLRLSNVPPSSPPRRLGGRLSHTQLWRCNSCTHSSFTRSFLARNLFTLIPFHNFLTQLLHTHTLMHHTFLTHTHTTLPHTTFYSYRSSITSFVSFLKRPNFNCCF